MAINSAELYAKTIPLKEEKHKADWFGELLGNYWIFYWIYIQIPLK
jgi:hypothetical protein